MCDLFHHYIIFELNVKCRIILLLKTLEINTLSDEDLPDSSLCMI